MEKMEWNEYVRGENVEERLNSKTHGQRKG